MQFSSQIRFRKKLWYSSQHSNIPHLTREFEASSEDLGLLRPQNIHLQPTCALCVHPSLCKSSLDQGLSSLLFTQFTSHIQLQKLWQKLWHIAFSPGNQPRSQACPQAGLIKEPQLGSKLQNLKIVPARKYTLKTHMPTTGVWVKLVEW